MARKEKKTWYQKIRFSLNTRIDPRWREYIEKEPGKSFAQKLDNSLAKIYGSRKKGK
jgi:hypothetical protein